MFKVIQNNNLAIDFLEKYDKYRNNKNVHTCIQKCLRQKDLRRQLVYEVAKKLFHFLVQYFKKLKDGQGELLAKMIKDNIKKS